MQLAKISQRVAARLSKPNHVLLTGTRTYSHKPSSQDFDIEQLLSSPTWSVSSLLPSTTTSTSSPQTTITPSQLHHLLRLSALPPPPTPASERKMLDTLSSQLHFVKDLQGVETGGVEPLQSLRDETEEGEREAELGLDRLREALGREERRGKWGRRVRRMKDQSQSGEKGQEKWDVLGTAEKRAGRYFVVEGGKEERG